MDIKKIFLLLTLIFAADAICSAQNAATKPYKISYRETLGLDTTKISALLEKGLDINAGYKSGVTLLDNAIFAGNYYEVKFLLDHGANINQQDDVGSTPLMIATENGLRNDSIAELLIERGADLNIISNRTESALMNTLGMKGGSLNPKIFKMLIDHGADYNYTCSSCRDRSIFIWCCEYGTPEMIQFMLDKKVNINQVDQDGVNGLMRACLDGKTENVRFLLQQPGIDLKHKDVEGMTVVDYAYTNGDETIMKLLREAIAKLN
jgi:ankyrin repeat protein